MSNDELKAQFEKCTKWGDPEQWDLLGAEYFRRGYMLNAGVCFKKADEIRKAKPQIQPAVIVTECGKSTVYAAKKRRPLREHGDVIRLDVVKIGGAS